MSKASEYFLSLKSGVKCISGVMIAFNSIEPKNTCLRQCQRSVTYPLNGLITILKIGIIVQIIPMTSIGIPRCLAIVGKNIFIGAIPEIIIYTFLLKKINNNNQILKTIHNILIRNCRSRRYENHSNNVSHIPITQLKSVIIVLKQFCYLSG